MKYGLCGTILFLLLAMPCSEQTPTAGKAATSGPCSPAVTGNENRFTISCVGVSKEQGQKMLDILNKILANQIDTKEVMAKLDEILHAVNPNIPVKTYFCNGKWRSMGPGPNTGLEMITGGDDKEFKKMIDLLNAKDNSGALTECLAQIQAAPEWLTPRLVCGVAYLRTGDTAKAKEMLAEFDSKTGPAYSADGCSQMSDYLHAHLQ